MMSINICHAQQKEQETVSSVRVTVKGIYTNKGNIMVGLGDIKNPTNMKGDMVKAEKDSVVCHIDGVPVGKQTIYVFQDINENKKMDMTEIGVPIEPCAMPMTVELKKGKNEVSVSLIEPKNIKNVK